MSRREADAALAELHQAIGNATQRTDELVRAVAETRNQATTAGQVAAAGAVGVAKTNADLEVMLDALREELATMKSKITGAEERADVAQRMADGAEQRADDARRAADAAEQRAVAAQCVADTAHTNQSRVEQDLRVANVAFQEERATRIREIAAARKIIGELRHDLHDANAKIVQQGTVVDNVAGLGVDLREAQQKMEHQSAEMKKLEKVADDMIFKVGDLTEAFHQIDAERGQENVVNPKSVKSAPVHVQGTQSTVTEPAEHVQTVPSSSVIDLVRQKSEGWKPESVSDYIKRTVEEKMQKVREEIRLGKQPATSVPNPFEAESFSAPQTSDDASTSEDRHPLHVPTPHATPSSQFAVNTGSFVPPPAPPQGNAGLSDVNRPPTVQPMSHESGESRVIVGRTPRLPSGTQRAIENIVQAHLDRLGINEKPNER